MISCSPQMQKYFDELNAKCKKEFAIAQAARKKNFDPSENVEIYLAANMAERVVGLTSVVAPQIVGSGVVERIIELEETYGKLDWRVALIISYEVAQQKFCTFKDELEAMEVGIRIGFAYGTVGIVSSPLEGLVNIQLKDRMDGQGKYMCLNFSGPIRNAGGTAASWSVLIADYVRKKMGYAEYDATESEIKRCATEVEDYHERVTNLQYFPSKRESEFLMKNIPIEVSGDASEKFDVSNFKDLPRIPTNKIRSGFCLIHSSCIPLKAPKLWKELSKWGKDLEMDQWNFLEEFIKIQKEEKSKGAGSAKVEKSDGKIQPVFTYIADLVAGRPVLSHPMRSGAFRLRYGRSRTSGYSAGSINPATMHALSDFIATGTQLKVERPGKGSAFTPCSFIEGPVILTNDNSVVKLKSEAQAKEYKKDIKEVIFTGDYLVNYGDFFDRAHKLIPPGYCVEWWVQEVEKAAVDSFGALDKGKMTELTGVPVHTIKNMFEQVFTTDISARHAFQLSEGLSVPLHPAHCFHWDSITPSELATLASWLYTIDVQKDEGKITKGILALTPQTQPAKRALEVIGCEHRCVLNENVVLTPDVLFALTRTIGTARPKEETLRIINEMQESKPEISTLEIVQQLSPVKLRDLSGCFIGARMGRPEKAKMRKMDGSPHTLFPVGEQGGRMKSFKAALESKIVKAEFPVYACAKCNTKGIYPSCIACNTKTVKEGKDFQEIDFVAHFKDALSKTGVTVYPDMIKGVPGVINKERYIEHMLKGILRAKYDVYVNKDGTIRYDASELPITHFKPSEVGASVEQLLELGYDKDIHGNPLTKEKQVLELKPQDMLLPCCPDSPDPRADDVLIRVTRFIDDLLEHLYGLPRYYNLSSAKDLIGHLVIGLAPHTSAGTVFRIVGFSKTQAFFCHPMGHAAMRRDCDGDESCLFLLMDALLNFSKHYLPTSRGSTMDAPLVLTCILNPAEVDDMVFNMDIAWKYPLDFYQACLEYKMPWDVKIPLLKAELGKPTQYEGMGFTHDTDDINAGVLCSSYKSLPSMKDKLEVQMQLAEKLRCVDTSDVARLVIEKHFIRDIKGNLRKFSQQEFRCVTCNTKYRRPPLSGKCTSCGGKILFTISEGSIVKYLEPSISLAERFGVPTYLKQTIELTKRRIEGVFGKEKEKQTGLGAWFG